MTKYLDQHRGWGQSNPNDISIIEEDQIRNVEGKEKEFICDTCKCNTLSRLIDSSGENGNYYYCTRCKTYAYDTDDLRTQSIIEEPKGPVEEVAVGTPPERTLRRRRNEPKGTFKRMQERGIHITSYKDTFRREKEE
jgi:hypothetical protein